MDARDYFLSLHDHAHGKGLSRMARRVLYEPTPDQMRRVVPGHNSIAWILWHIARGEDWGVNAMLRGEEQVLKRDNWNKALKVERLDFGAGMTDEEVAALTRRIDLEALKAYFEAVTAETRGFIATYDFDRLDEPIDVSGRLARSADAFAPNERLIRAGVEQQTTGRWFLNVMALMDVMQHVNEAGHVLRTIAPEMRWP